MRAIYLDTLSANDNGVIVSNPDQVHHLNNVVRVKINEDLLILDGKGHYVFATIGQIEKKLIKINFESEIQFEPPRNCPSIAIGSVKREALELSLRQLVEVGVSKIYIFQSRYSQKQELNQARIDKILISALEQSNAKYLPQIDIIEFEDLLRFKYDDLIYFSSVSKNNQSYEMRKHNKDNSLVVIGPEGGLSEDEEEKLKKYGKSIIINLPTNILRTSTAVTFCLGYIFGLRQNI